MAPRPGQAAYRRRPRVAGQEGEVAEGAGDGVHSGATIADLKGEGLQRDREAVGVAAQLLPWNWISLSRQPKAA